MSFEERILEVRSLVRSGAMREARAGLRELCARPPKRRFAVEVAHLARIAGLAELSLRLLHGRVRGEETATEEEKAEYGMALAMVGAGREATAILGEIDATRFPWAFHGLILAHFRQWNWSAALPLTRRYLGKPGISESDRLNAAYYFGRALLHGGGESGVGEAIELFERLAAETHRLEYGVLYHDSLLALADAHYLGGSWKLALRVLDELERVIAGTDGSPQWLSARQLRAETLLQSSRGRDRSALAELRRIRALWAEGRRWERVRECDYEQARATGDERLLVHLFFGTPFPAARARFAAELGGPGLPASYDWKLSGGAEGARLDVLSGTFGGSGGGTAALKPGQLVSRTISALARDFYSPPALATLHELMYPGQAIHPVAGPARVRQALKTARQTMARERIPVRILESRGRYSLAADKPFTLRLPSPKERDEEREKDRESDPSLSGWLACAKETFGGREFTSVELARARDVSERTARRFLKEAGRRGWVRASRRSAREVCYRALLSSLLVLAPLSAGRPAHAEDGGYSRADSVAACFSPPVSSPETRALEDIDRNLGCPLFRSRISSGREFPLMDTEHGKVSVLWAQEEIGADLGRDFMASWNQDSRNIPTRDIAVGVLDVGIQPGGFRGGELSPSLQLCREDPSACGDLGTKSHGTKVGNLIVGPAGVSGHAHLSRIDAGGRLGSDLAAAYSRMDAPGPDRPEIVNMSLGEGTLSPDASRALSKLSQDAIVVHSAGNSFPAPLDSYLGSTHGIVVGSLTPEGLPSDFSSAGHAVTISAPSDYTVVSMSTEDSPGSRHPAQFSGTSAAAALVSGAIANVASFLPGLTTEEATVLLARTAIQTSGFRPPSGNEGAGSVNAYGMIRVAAQLRAGWPASRARLREPVDAKLFDFSGEARNFRVQAYMALRDYSCGSQREAARLLRTAFFLDPDNSSTRATLAELYHSNGLDAQAAFFAGKSARETVEGIAEPGAKLMAAVREGIPPESLFADAGARRAAYLEAFRAQDVYEESLANLARRAFRDPSAAVRSAFLEAQPADSPVWSRTVLTKAALEDSVDPALRARAVHDACVWQPARELGELLVLASVDASPAVRAEGAHCASTCRGVYARAPKGEDPGVRAQRLKDLADCSAIPSP
jgi:tetratricopeptide (TPR) repeat protein